MELGECYIESVRCPADAELCRAVHAALEGAGATLHRVLYRETATLSRVRI
jgi:hypothetical protein